MNTSEELKSETVLPIQFFPWHLSQKKMLQELFHSGRMHHAFLLYGPKGIGKFDFACAMAASMFCENIAEQSACGHCRACAMFQAGTHPDFYLLGSEEGKQIVVDEIRALVAFMSKSASRQGKRIVIIDDCDKLNNSASNALLKFLEEPGKDVHLFLICQQIENLLPTINSRCQKLAFSNIPREMLVQWLETQAANKELVSDALFEFANGSPVDALELVDSPFFLEREKIVSCLSQSIHGTCSTLAAFRVLEDYELRELLKFWFSWCLDILKLKTQTSHAHLRFQSMMASIEVLAPEVNENSLPAFMERLLLEIQQLQKGSTVNQALLLQELLIGWRALSQKS